ncbi:MAG: AbrB/MazE/SpoVT family DNA-binding domain-containing protein [Myxococcales bacterium]|nr:AbrB/MazE/SpoVT family DNA-binding domain-containing protein [Myxococcales bacterium]
MIIGERGQITIPKQLRDKYGLLPQTEVEFIEQEGQLMVRRKVFAAPVVSPLERWVGFLKNTPEDVDAFIEDIRGR